MQEFLKKIKKSKKSKKSKNQKNQKNRFKSRPPLGGGLDSFF
jgi:hypothetical protein